MKEKFAYYLKNFFSIFKFSKYYNNIDDLDGIAADIIRNTHSIEKGLSIDNVRMGFGHKKQKYMMELICKLEKCDNSYYAEVIKMALASLNSYIIFHDKNGYNDDFIDTLRDFINCRSGLLDSSFGGVIDIDSSSFNFNISDIEHFFNTRHSIRLFSKTPVDENLLLKAIELAQRAPSACNRQGVRVYVVDKSKADLLKNQLGGVGGFADDIDKFIIVTGKLSTYKLYESNQYIVSSSIYVGYLTLALHAYGLGSCVIQRPVIWNSNSQKLKKYYGIKDDEQIVCLLGVGNIEGHFSVPVSHRINIEEFAKIIK